MKYRVLWLAFTQAASSRMNTDDVLLYRATVYLNTEVRGVVLLELYQHRRTVILRQR